MVAPVPMNGGKRRRSRGAGRKSCKKCAPTKRRGSKRRSGSKKRRSGSKKRKSGSKKRKSGSKKRKSGKRRSRKVLGMFGL